MCLFFQFEFESVYAEKVDQERMKNVYVTEQMKASEGDEDQLDEEAEEVLRIRANGNKGHPGSGYKLTLAPVISSEN